MNVSVATSPVSVGVTSTSAGVVPHLPQGDHFLDEARHAGYAGVELGPQGYLGQGRELVEGLVARDLGVSGASLELPLALHDVEPVRQSTLDAVLDVLDLLRERVPGPVPRMTLADAGDERRRAAPGVARIDPDQSGLDDEGWERFAQRLDAVVRHCRRRGYPVALRPRVGSYIEAPWEIDAAMRASDVGLCLDTGQVLLGGGDPVAVLREWSSRVAQVYLKDALVSRMQDVIDEGEPASAVWSRQVFCALGEGDVDCVGVLQQLEVVGYRGWLVVEHDAFPSSLDRIVQGFDDQRRNREFLIGQGF